MCVAPVKGFGVAKVREVSDRELAVAIACLARVPAEEALAPFLGDALPVDESLLIDQRLIDAFAFSIVHILGIGTLDRIGQAAVFELANNKRLIKLQSDFLGQTTLVHLELATNNNN